MKRIVLTGPESTGKSQLSLELSKYYHCPMIHEIARDYLQQISGKYTMDDVLKIAKMQIETEKAMLQDDLEYLFVDTDLL